VAGKSNKEIAAELSLSAYTVAGASREHHGRAGIHKTAELVVYAIRNGLVTFAVKRRDFLAHTWRRRSCGVGVADRGTGGRCTLAAGFSSSRTLPPRRASIFGTTAARMAASCCRKTLGSGCAFLDYDNDGWQDILMVNAMDWPGHKRQRSTPHLYRNNRDGTFADVTKKRGPGHRNVWNGRSPSETTTTTGSLTF